MGTEWNGQSLMLCDLLEQVKTAHVMAGLNAFKEMSLEEHLRFSKDHPGAHIVIGDFEIKCLKPEKYNL